MRKVGCRAATEQAEELAAYSAATVGERRTGARERFPSIPGTSAASVVIVAEKRWQLHGERKGRGQFATSRVKRGLEIRNTENCL